MKYISVTNVIVISKILLVRSSQLVFEIISYLDLSKMRESRKQVKKNAQVSSSI
jgi:hypothetical protein